MKLLSPRVSAGACLNNGYRVVGMFILITNGNALDEKGKKYGSFNPTSVNLIRSLARGKT